ncbi:MAG: hypothetical protein ACLGHY_05010, partial [Gammaproteobacteria bacterium]
GGLRGLALRQRALARGFGKLALALGSLECLRLGDALGCRAVAGERDGSMLGLHQVCGLLRRFLLVVLALVVILTLIRPALKAMRRPAEPARGPASLTARIDDPLHLPDPLSGAALALPTPLRNEDIVKIARENPAAVANIVRGWVGSQAKGA